MIYFVTGGARSGKSQFAETLAEQSAGAVRDKPTKPLYYLATATVYDDEMQQRVELHKSRRNDAWQLIEEPLNIATCLSQLPDESSVLIDCMTLWVTNWLCSENRTDFAAQQQQFLTLLADKYAGSNSADCIIVSNEVGSGIVPMGELSRDFVDESGWLNQAIAQLADEANLVVAGLPLKLK